MRIFVDELPKSCEECPMCRSGKLKLQRKGRYVEVEQCVFGQYKYQTIDDEIDTCPLQSLADHEKQVRKQVCDEIRKIIIQKDSKLEKSTYSDSFVSGYHCCYCDVEQCLDQIEKGE